MKTAIILDVDGTLWDTTAVVADAWNAALQTHHMDHIKITPNLLKSVFGRPMDQVGDMAFASEQPQIRAELLEICCHYEHDFLKTSEEPMLFPNVIETLKELSQKTDLYIVSNCQSGYIELFLEKFQLTSIVKDIECYGNTLKGKADNIRMLMERNHVEHAVYVGDTSGDQAASCAAGIPFIFASYGFGTVTDFYKQIGSFEELLPLYEEVLS